MIINEILSIILQLATLYFFIRSLLYMFRIRLIETKINFYAILMIIVIAISLTAYNLSDFEYVSKRFPFNNISTLGMAWCLYLLCKSKKHDLFTITNIKKLEYSDLEKSVMIKIDAKEGEVSQRVTAEDLKTLQVGNSYHPSNKTSVIRLNPPLVHKLKFKFRASLLEGGEFGDQYHPKLKEFIYVDSGAIKDKVTGKIYRAGDIWEIPAGQPHNPLALELTELSAYLYEV